MKRPRANPKRVLFAEGEEGTCCAPRSPSAMAATARRCWSGATMSTTGCASSGVEDPQSFEVLNSRNSPLVGRAVDLLYQQLQRRGICAARSSGMVNQDRNIFAAVLLALGEADAMITGITRPFSQSLRQVRRVIDEEQGATPFGIHVIVGRRHTVFIADTTVTERPNAEQLCRDRDADRRASRGAWGTSRASRSSATPPSAIRRACTSSELRDAVKILDERHVRFRI